ncbi:hypothetical protein BCEP4_1170024 [Burkholderia cepacia]|nr:hypothetical protein BCEP4_1170024 [Burkholderia cepacia]
MTIQNHLAAIPPCLDDPEDSSDRRPVWRYPRDTTVAYRSFRISGTPGELPHALKANGYQACSQAKLNAVAKRFNEPSAGR